jgi:hypothetical protein
MLTSTIRGITLKLPMSFLLVAIINPIVEPSATIGTLAINWYCDLFTTPHNIGRAKDNTKTEPILRLNIMKYSSIGIIARPNIIPIPKLLYNVVIHPLFRMSQKAAIPPHIGFCSAVVLGIMPVTPGLNKEET